MSAFRDEMKVVATLSGDEQAIAMGQVVDRYAGELAVIVHQAEVPVLGRREFLEPLVRHECAALRFTPAEQGEQHREVIVLLVLQMALAKATTLNLVDARRALDRAGQALRAEAEDPDTPK